MQQRHVGGGHQQHHLAARFDQVFHAGQRAGALLQQGAAVGHQGELALCAVVFRLGRTTERVEQTLVIQNTILEQQSEEIRSLKDETKKVNDVLLTIALQKREIDAKKRDAKPFPTYYYKI